MRRERLEPLNLSIGPLKSEASASDSPWPDVIESAAGPDAFASDAPSAAPDVHDPWRVEAEGGEPDGVEASALPPLPPPPTPVSAAIGTLPEVETPRERKLRHKRERQAIAAADRSAPAPTEGASAARSAPMEDAPATASAIGRAKAAKPPPPARFAYLVAGLCALLWAGAFAAFVIGFGRLGPFDYAPFRDAIVAGMAILPALFILLFAYALRQGARLSEDVRSTRRLSEDLVGPVAVSAAQTGDLMHAMRAEIAETAQAAEDAGRRLAALRADLSDESRRLAEAAQAAESGARTLGAALGQERGELEALSALLQTRTVEITDAVGRQSRMAADVSDLAQAHLAEAQAGLVARAADLSAAAADVREGAAAAAGLLGQQGDRLDAVGAGLSQRLVRLSDDLNRERERLTELTDGLKQDHEALAAQAESGHARMAEAAGQARTHSEAASLAAIDTAETLEQLVRQTAAQVRGVADAAGEAHRSVLFDAQDHLERFTGEADRARAVAADSAEQTLAALADATATAQNAASARIAELQAQAQTLGASALERIEQLGEAAFAAGQRADQAFDSRIAAAKRAIDQSAAAVEEAGLRSAQRIEAGLAGTRAALAELDTLLADVDGRFSKLPEEARERADAVRSAVEQGVGDLTAAARRAAEETQAIDAAFQERVRRNYDTLSEAVRLMGRVAGAVNAAAARSAEPVVADTSDADVHALDLLARFREDAARRTAEPIADPLPLAVGDSHSRIASVEPAARVTAPAVAASATEPAEAFGLQMGQASGGDLDASELFPEPAPIAEPGPDAGAIGLRPRLKLTVEPPQALRAAEPPAPRGEGWSWKDLLSTLPADSDGMVEDGDAEALADRLIGEIEALGLDAAALLPRAQVEEIAHARQTGRDFGAREGVRRLAPAAVRRLSRRVLTDPVLRREADQFVRRYAAMVDDAASRDADGFLVSALLGSDAGRAFLMLDAAIGDLAH